jgi:hypothetical protein
MMKTAPPNPAPSANVIALPLPKKDQRRADAKWSPQVMKLRYMILPNLLFRAQGKLEISPVQLNVLLHLIEHWWEADKDPSRRRIRSLGE